MAEIPWIERAYTNFFYRDLCHIFSGGLLLCVFEYMFLGDILLPEGFTLQTIGFILLSYFLGIGIVSKNTIMIYILDNYFNLYKIDKKFSNELLLKQKIIEKYDIGIIDEIERINFLTLIGRTVGISSFLSGILMAIFGLYQIILEIKDITFEYFLITIFLLTFGILLTLDYFNWRNFYIEQLNDFNEEIAKKTK